MQDIIEKLKFVLHTQQKKGYVIDHETIKHPQVFFEDQSIRLVPTGLSLRAYWIQKVFICHEFDQSAKVLILKLKLYLLHFAISMHNFCE